MHDIFHFNNNDLFYFLVLLLYLFNFNFLTMFTESSSEYVHPTLPLYDPLNDPTECPAGPAFAISSSGNSNGN